MTSQNEAAVRVIQAVFRGYCCRKYLFVAQSAFDRIDAKLLSPLMQLPELSLCR